MPDQRRTLRELWTRSTTPREERGSDVSPAYVRSYLAMRAAVGVLGLLLPWTLVVGDRWLFGAREVRPSLSDYYYSGLRDVFVGVLCAIGVFLVTYKVAERSLDNQLSSVAGFAAVGVALFPTRPLGDDATTPLQSLLGISTTSVVHFGSAAVFMVALAGMSFLFGRREGRRARRSPTAFSPQAWRRFHWTCSAVIVASVLFIVLSFLTDAFGRHAVLIGESAAVLAFGASWLGKGAEIVTLLRRPRTG